MQLVKGITRKTQSKLVRTIGARLKEARELCNISQTKASEFFGYKNSGRLSKLENAMHTNNIPLWIIPRAAQYYDVSCDYLFGLVDDFETGAYLQVERDTSAWLFDVWQKQRAKDMQTLAILNKKIEAINHNISALNYATNQAVEAFNGFVKLNPIFDDLKGGAKFMQAIRNLEHACNSAVSAVKKFKLECKSAKIHPNDKQQVFNFD